MATRALSADARRASSEIHDDISAPNRRGLLAMVAGAGAMALATPIAAATHASNDVIERQFTQWKEALHRLNNDDGDEAYDAPLWEVLNATEDAIVRFEPASPRVAVMRLWIALQSELTGSAALNLVCREDLAGIVRLMPDEDWSAQILIQALRGLTPLIRPNEELANRNTCN